ncbi:hypothetical protein H9Q72_009036 [Fusarium xylarioides]|uniref:Uncharacterized protein n=1 Tax=Fusarium xylarioides TaxID=221167 RepID=A0A9P7KZ84_9HYPO|nr:hypothetical protein H9Q72_009036 [Fusarium xylarioides]
MVDGKETPNIVIFTGDNCEYFQIPPSINQPVAHVNQPPMSDGLFELPPADTADQWKMNILDDFIQNLKMKDYALRMIEILGDASSCMAPPAESYSSVMDAASGRAFALAIAGWSIELNHEELQPQTSLGNLAGKSYSKLSDYDLSLYLGLKEYSDDGLAAYMPLRSDSPTQPDFGKIFTFWPSGVTKTGMNEDFACSPIHPSTLPTLKARHVDLFQSGGLLEVDGMIKRRHEQLLPFCLLVDAFHPVKAQTGVFPPSSLPIQIRPCDKRCGTSGYATARDRSYSKKILSNH